MAAGAERGRERVMSAGVSRHVTSEGGGRGGGVALGVKVDMGGDEVNC